MASLKDIDTSFDFTSDTPGYWDNFWTNNDGLGKSLQDPDAKSPMLRKYHQLLWSRVLPNGEFMDLQIDRKWLKWGNDWFSSDSITTSFRHKRDLSMISKVMESMSDYHSFVEDYLHRLYTIGGMIIFPTIPGSVNQERGCSIRIRDRWDLTLECIRRHYAGEDHPLMNCFSKPDNARFFAKFIDFKGYVDYFFLQDLVTADYSKVNLWLDTPLFIPNPIPHDVNSYMDFINAELEFVQKRNTRIAEFCAHQGN